MTPRDAYDTEEMHRLRSRQTQLLDMLKRSDEFGLIAGRPIVDRTRATSFRWEQHELACRRLAELILLEHADWLQEEGERDATKMALHVVAQYDSSQLEAWTAKPASRLTRRPVPESAPNPDRFDALLEVILLIRLADDMM